MNAVITGNLELDYAGSEAMNTICSNLLFAGRNIRKIVITSCDPDDGKSFIAMQIAVNMAKRGKRTLLIDADMRLSVLNTRYGIQLSGKRMGLSHFLSGQCSLEEVLYQTDLPNVFLVPVGSIVQAPLSLIGTPDFDQMIRDLGENFELIIIDAPPIGRVIDAAEIARSCDGSILVLEYGKTHIRALQEAKQQMERTGTPILGCILNKVMTERWGIKKYYKGRYRKRYGYGKHGYGKYGYSKYGYSRYGYSKYGYGRYGNEKEADRNNPDAGAKNE